LRRLYEVSPAAQAGTLEHAVWRSIYALEDALTEERGKTTRLARTRQKIAREGEAKTVADLVTKSASDGYRMLMERGWPGLAQLAEVGFFREVRVKGFDSMQTRTLIAARMRLLRITTELSNQIRGLMKTFGLVVPAGKGSRFERHVQERLIDQQEVASIVRPLLEVWRAARQRAAELGEQLVTAARKSEACQILMSIPGVGAMTATAFATAIEDPGNFRKSRSVGAWLGLTTRRYQSGEVDYDGHISRRGDSYVRAGCSMRRQP